MKGRIIGGGGVISRTLTQSIINYIVPPSANWLYVKVWGGGGGSVELGHSAGSGAFCKVLIPVTQGETLNTQVAARGEAGIDIITPTRSGAPGGRGFGLFRGSAPLVIAGGGGGVGGFFGTDSSGRGGFPNGTPLTLSESPPLRGRGGTQSAGGLGGIVAQSGGYLFGGKGLGNNSGSGNGGGGGGGGGYFGGGGGTGGDANEVSRQGGGGSSFSAPGNDNVFMSDGMHGGSAHLPPSQALSDIDYANNASYGSYREIFGQPLVQTPGDIRMVIYAYRAKPDYSIMP